MKKLITPTSILNGTTKFHAVNSPRSHLVFEQAQDPKNSIINNASNNISSELNFSLILNFSIIIFLGFVKEI